ncbi:hypothetical protein SEA_MOLIVIA_90 [Arthrobacter phage Molivia]|uniref:Uncharacterized protein n=1 Tax=Arthrobacter phage Molivia TaxID=2015839 RepID=A0A286S1Y0_9CAUD|nr:hypothetical protein FDI28_gp26 [Arthrobacter phage Molivia]ASX99311.1 hypothetical protein SEA_MOLIVIA_90 [Arthrobacter phage Molivia]
MSNVISVVSAYTGHEVASVNTNETTFREAVQLALGFPEVSHAPVATRIQLETELRNAWNAATDQEIRSDLLRSVGIDHVKVSVGVTAEDAPEELTTAGPDGLDVVVNSAVLNAPVADFNTTDYSLEELKAEAMGWHEVRSASAATQLGLIATAREVLAATEGKTITNEHLAAVGIASVVVGDGGKVAETPATAPEAEETPVYAELVAEKEAKPVDAPLSLDKPVAVAPAPAKFVDTPLAAVPVTKTITKWRGLSNKVAAAVAVAAGVVGAIIGGSIF